MLRTIILLACVCAILPFTGCGSTGDVLPADIDANELAKIVSPDTSLEDFKGMIGNFANEKKKAIGDAIYKAAEKQLGITDQLKQEVAAYVGPESGLSTLRGKLAESMKLVKGLQGKLGAVVDGLEGSGLDVSEFTKLLSK